MEKETIKKKALAAWQKSECNAVGAFMEGYERGFDAHNTEVWHTIEFDGYGYDDTLPQEPYGDVLIQTQDGTCFTASYGEEETQGWYFYVIGSNLSFTPGEVARWAYLSDLFPKGGVQ